MRKIIVALVIIFAAFTFTKHAEASDLFPPCFPFCGMNVPWITPTVTPTPTQAPTVTPTPTTVPSPTTTPEVTPTPTGGSHIYWGAYTGAQPRDSVSLDAFEAFAQKDLSIVMWYQSQGVTDGTQNFQANWMNTVRNHGSIPMVTLEPWDYTRGVNQTRYRLSQITSGRYDAYYRKWAQDSKNWGKPYFLRFAHEMNGTWYPWAEGANGNKAGDYIKAYRRVHDIFVAEGATNVQWVWCPNVVYPGSTPLTQLYPGDAYVDWLCMDGYNWGVDNGGWQDFTTLFTPTYNQLTALSSKPIMIGETASAEIGGNKSEWITNTLTSALQAKPAIKAFIWFNENKERDWRINSSSSALSAFQAGIASDYFLGDDFGSISQITTP